LKILIYTIATYTLVVLLIALTALLSGCKKADRVCKPAIVLTDSLSNVTAISAITNNSVTNCCDAPVIESGIYYATHTNPTKADFVVKSNASGLTFSVNMRNLLPNTTYYLKAYAVTKAGAVTGNEVTFITASAPVFTDIDGNQYRYITIGHQIWMTSNLRVTRYRNGDPIVDGTTALVWGIATNPGAYAFANGTPINDVAFGKYYNVQAVNDPRNIAPVGWHIPSDEEWKTLEINQGMSREEADDIAQHYLRGNIAQKLMQGGSSGLNLQLAGYHGQTFDYELFGEAGTYWTSTQAYLNTNWVRAVNFSDDNSVIRSTRTNLGLAVRCIKD
jgi:uncharacterized protein (TIGR02145 family)